MLKQMRIAMAEALDVMEDVTWLAYVPASPPLPAGYIYPDLTEYDAAMARGADWWTVTAQALIADVGDEEGQDLLDTMLEPFGGRSVKQLLEADPTLGGLVDNVQVVQCSGYRRYLREGGGPIFGAEWTVRVFAEGKP